MITNKKPAILKQINKVFPHAIWENGLIVAYYPNIHVGPRSVLTKPKEMHEFTHLLQQQNYPTGPKGWWERYLSDKDFLLEQEIQAYKVETEWHKKHTKDRNAVHRAIHGNALTLSSSIYGGIISYSEAYKLIK